MKKSTKILGIALLTLLGFGKSFAQAPVVSFTWGLPASPCVGANVAITGSVVSGTVTAWGYSLTGASVPTSTFQNPFVTFTVSGTQTITLIALNGATPSAPVVQTISIKPSPTLTITSSQTAAACPGTTANLTASGGTAYSWVAPLTSTVAVATITLNGNSPTYSVVGTGTNGCTSTGTFVQLVTPNPVTIASSPVSTIMCTGESKTLTASGGTAYTWQAPLSSTVAAAVISPTAAGNFTYTVLSTSSVCPSYTWTTAFTQSVSGCVGIQNSTNKTVSFGVYPNPTSGDFTIELNNGAVKLIEVMDLMGRVVFTNTSSNDKINVNISSLTKGIYYIRVQSNNTIETSKIVKQ